MSGGGSGGGQRKRKEKSAEKKRKKESTERDCVLSRRFDRVPVGFGFSSATY